MIFVVSLCFPVHSVLGYDFNFSNLTSGDSNLRQTKLGLREEIDLLPSHFLLLFSHVLAGDTNLLNLETRGDRAILTAEQKRLIEENKAKARRLLEKKAIAKAAALALVSGPCQDPVGGPTPCCRFPPRREGRSRR